MPGENRRLLKCSQNKIFWDRWKHFGKNPYLSQLFWRIGLKLANNLYPETIDNLFNQAQLFRGRFIDVVLISWSNLTWSCISTRSLNSFSEHVWHRLIACQVKLDICFAFLNWFHCLTWACLIEATNINKDVFSLLKHFLFGYPSINLYVCVVKMFTRTLLFWFVNNLYANYT